MSNRIYPRKVWVLQPSLKPLEVTVIEKYKSWGGEYDGDLTEKGKLFSVDSMFDSKEDAITAGRSRCAIIRADLDKREETLRKKMAALDKAEAK